MAEETKTTTTNIVRYAEYLETAHKSILATLAIYTNDTASALNPFTSFNPWDVDQLFFDPANIGDAAGNHPRLFDLFEQRVRNLDLHGMYLQVLDRFKTDAIEPIVAATEDSLLDRFDSVIDPRFKAGMRDMNSVMSSQYTVGRALLLRDITRQITTLRAQLTTSALELSSRLWEVEVQHTMQVPTMYSAMISQFIDYRTALETHTYTMTSKATLWPFTILGQAANIISAMAGATNSNSEVVGESRGGGSKLSTGIGIALQALSIGATIYSASRNRSSTTNNAAMTLPGVN